MKAKPTTQSRVHSATQKQVPNAPAKRLKVPFGAAIETILPAPASSAALLNLFDHRATVAAIQSWRFGIAIPPQWAIELVEQRSLARHQVTVAELKKISPRREHQGLTNLRRWRASQA